MSVRLSQIVACDAAGRLLASVREQDSVRRSVFDILESNILISVATVTPDGSAYIHTAHFCYSPDLCIYFLSHPDSRHCRNLLVNSTAAATLFSSAQPWLTTCVGLQLFGEATAAKADEAAKAEDLYARRFPAYGEWSAAKNGMESEFRYYAFTVRSLKVMDEARLGDGVLVSARVERD